ncbi:hypothetical protein QVD17_21000 [Tagetes erecta]|uniref:Uncharacterized protein n=1 Tax=Tagetes erecta TaxID=13708 RepID=A0AAD8KM84_TARER|nr:hypothetical protein QVD17_21000 [Tagetes erecta]
MDTNTTTTTTHSLQIDTTNDFDSLFYELEKQILTLIADDEDSERVGSIIAKRPTSVWINRPRYILEQQHENYFCWKHDFESSVDSLPVWLVNSWRNTTHGTGVFIPRTQHRNKPIGGFTSRRCKARGRRYNRLVDELNN